MNGDQVYKLMWRGNMNGGCNRIVEHILPSGANIALEILDDLTIVAPCWTESGFGSYFVYSADRPCTIEAEFFIWNDFGRRWVDGGFQRKTVQTATDRPWEMYDIKPSQCDVVVRFKEL